MKYEYRYSIGTYGEVDYRNLEPRAEFIKQMGNEGFKLVKFDVVRGKSEFTIIVVMEKALESN